MKYIACADLHLRASKPILRTETDFLSVCLDKVKQIVDLANEHEADILIAGDLFHSCTVSYKVLNKFSDYLDYLSNRIIFVDGQHDRENHTNDFFNTPILSLTTMGCGSRLFLRNDRYGNTFDSIYGTSWKDEIPKIEADILLVHKCVTPSKPPFFLKDAVSAKEMLKTYPNFKYIVTGDYHESFMTEYKGRFLINPGSMTRMKIDQIDHEPSVYLIDTNKEKVERIKLKVKPAEEVFNLDKSESDKDFKKFQDEIKELIESLKIKARNPKYKHILEQVIQQSRASKSVQKIIKESMK